MNRRSFLTLLAGGAGIVAAAPVRRFWAVGATLERLPFTYIWGMDLGLRGSSAVISQRWHESDLVRELQGYRGGLDDSVDAAPGVVHMDPRLAKSSLQRVHIYKPSQVSFRLGDVELACVDDIKLHVGGLP